MKLYATITSERASKGQGGNKNIEVVLLGQTDDKENKVVAKIHGYHDKENGIIRYVVNPMTTSYLFNHNGNVLDITLQTKGKQQKGKIDCGCEKGIFVCYKHRNK